MGDYGTGDPGPTSPDEHPTPVMKGRITPGSVVHPSPSPGGDPSPVAVMIGSPTGSDYGGTPNPAVIGIFTPSAISIEIRIAGDVAGDVAAGFGHVLAAVAVRAPIVEGIGGRNRARIE